MDISWILFGVLLLMAPVLYSSIRLAPPLSTKSKDRERMMIEAQIGSDDHVVDLGAGSGALVFACLQYANPASVTAIEISPVHILILFVRKLFSKKGKKLRIEVGDIYAKDLSRYTKVVVFGTPKGFETLTPHLLEKLSPGTTITSYIFEFPTLKPTRVSRPTPNDFPIYTYTI